MAQQARRFDVPEAPSECPYICGVVIHTVGDMNLRFSKPLRLFARCLDRWPDARHVHRLDQDTSGLVVMALTIDAAREMCRQFRERGERIIDDHRRVSHGSGAVPAAAHVGFCSLLISHVYFTS